MKSEETSCETFIIFNMSFIETLWDLYEKGFYVETYKQVCGT